MQLPFDKFPETAAHIKEAIKDGKTDICTIDRKEAGTGSYIIGMKKEKCLYGNISG
ncbi:TPA: hypothetical protein QCU33_005817 [Bacillus cereus]|nr:hypothetical protein [Bacillus cereus]